MDSTRPFEDGYCFYYLPIEIEKSEVNLNWLPLLIDNREKKISIDQMSEFSSGLIELMRNNDLQTVNKVLKEVITENSSIETIVTCLRTTFTIRYSLHNWKEALNISLKRVHDLGRNPNRVLIGLI